MATKEQIKAARDVLEDACPNQFKDEYYNILAEMIVDAALVASEWEHMARVQSEKLHDALELLTPSQLDNLRQRWTRYDITTKEK